MTVSYSARRIGDRVALIRDEPEQATVSEMELQDARTLRDQLNIAIARVEAWSRVPAILQS